MHVLTKSTGFICLNDPSLSPRHRDEFNCTSWMLCPPDAGLRTGISR